MPTVFRVNSIESWNRKPAPNYTLDKQQTVGSILLFSKCRISFPFCCSAPVGYLGTNKVPTAPHTFFCLLPTWCACRRCRKTWGTRVRFCQPCVVMRVRVHVCVVYMYPDWHRWDPCEESVRANLVGHQTATTPTSMANTGNTNGWLHPSARKPPPPLPPSRVRLL